MQGNDDMTPKPTPSERLAAAIPSRRVRGVFVASLAANLLVFGFAIGDAFHGGPHPGPRAVEMTLGPIARALTEDDRKLVLQSINGDPALQPFGRNDHRVDVSALVAALQIEPFDTAKVRTAIEAQSAKVTGAQHVVQEAVLSRLAAMSVKDRAQFVARLQDN